SAEDHVGRRAGLVEEAERERLVRDVAELGELCRGALGPLPGERIGALVDESQGSGEAFGRLMAARPWCSDAARTRGARFAGVTHDGAAAAARAVRARRAGGAGVSSAASTAVRLETAGGRTAIAVHGVAIVAGLAD